MAIWKSLPRGILLFKSRNLCVSPFDSTSKKYFDSKLLKIRYNNIILHFLGKILRRMASNKDFFIVSFQKVPAMLVCLAVGEGKLVCLTTAGWLVCQSLSRPVSQSVGHPGIRSVSRLVGGSVDRCVGRTGCWSFCWSLSQSVDR